MKAPYPNEPAICPACNGSGAGVADTDCGFCGGCGGVPVHAAEALISNMAEDAAKMGAETRNCGSCRLWAPNFYTHVTPEHRGTTCCADAVMDLPASFIPSRQTMVSIGGKECICWQASE